VWAWPQTSPCLVSPVPPQMRPDPASSSCSLLGDAAPNPPTKGWEALMVWVVPDAPHGPSSSFHHWRSLPHHKLRPACRKHHRGRREQRGPPRSPQFWGGGWGAQEGQRTKHFSISPSAVFSSHLTGPWWWGMGLSPALLTSWA